MKIRDENLVSALLLGGFTTILAYRVLNELFDYREFIKLGTIDEPPEQHEIDGFKKNLQYIYENPDHVLITHARVDKLRIKGK